MRSAFSYSSALVQEERRRRIIIFLATKRGPPVQLGTGSQAKISFQVKSSLYINNRKPYGSLLNVLRGGQQWWKGVGGDDGGDPSRADGHLVGYERQLLIREVHTVL